jgi:hypothetical protein
LVLDYILLVVVYVYEYKTLVGACNTTEVKIFSHAIALRILKIKVHIHYPERHHKFVHLSCLSDAFLMLKKAASAVVNVAVA